MSKISLIQRERGLGESGLVETDCLRVLVDGAEVAAFDNYLLVCSYSSGRGVNGRGDRFCFVARKLPDGFLPETDIEGSASDWPMHLCVCDLTRRSQVVAEFPVTLVPAIIRWDEDGNLPVFSATGESASGVTLERVIGRTVREAKGEYDEARRNMNTPGTVTKNDPMNDPARLEYHLFHYDPRYVRGTPFEYASRMRNKYFLEHGLAVPYEVPDDGDRPVPARVQVSSPLEEIRAAKAHLYSDSEPIGRGDPIYDPTRLEHYLFEHNPSVSTTTAIAYAIHARNAYLRSHGIPVPYEDMDELDIRAMEMMVTSASATRKEAASPGTAKEAKDTMIGKKDKEEKRKQGNRTVILWSVIVGLLFLLLAAVLVWKGKPGAAGGVIYIPMVAFMAAITRITRNYQPAIPGNYNLWRLLLFFVLLFSSATYQLARGMNRLVEMFFGAAYPGWTFIVVSVPVIGLWSYARVRKGRSADIREAKRWGWLVPLCASILLGFLMYFIRAIK